MKPPSFVRELSEKERERLEAGLRSKDAFVMRRCQFLLASARGLSPPKIAESLGCASQTVRNAIRAFNERGLDALLAGSSRPKHGHAAFDGKSAEALREMLHRSPREFGRNSSLWTLGRWPPRSPSRRGSPKSASAERRFGRRFRASFRFGGCGLSDGSPPPTPYTKEKRRRDRLMEISASDSEWATAFEDECWWSRVALPTLNAWSEDAEPWRLVQRSVEKDDPSEATKAISCYGLYVPELDGQTWLRFVDGRQVSHITTALS
jgi:transposase